MSGLKPLRAEQAAASAPAAHVWLSASAGTGKTHVLTARVFRLLLNDVPPERILCLTFTKAGAAEMANRVHERLAAWVRMDDVALFNDLEALGEPSGPEAREAARLLFAGVLEATGGGLRIQTIHSFCQTLLGAFPLEAGLVPGFRPLDDRGQAELARSTLVDLILRAEEVADDALLDALAALSLRLGEGDAERYLMRCAQAVEALDGLDEDVAGHILKRFGLPDGDVDAIIEEACTDEQFDCESLRYLASANAAWGTATGLNNADAIAAWLAASPAARAASIGSIRSVVLTKEGKPKAVPKKIAASDPAYEGYAIRVAEACEEIDGLRVRVAYAGIVAQGLHAGRAFARAYADAKRRKGAVDFNDLIAWTIGLLREGQMAEWIRYKLDQGIDHILVDEAQDTNRDQWRIVDALVEEYFAPSEQGGLEPGEKPRTLFVVGDDKQAIFGFQGTSPDAFRMAKDGFLARALIADHAFSVLPLSESFRSTPPVLEAVDAVLADLGPDAIGLAEPPPAHLSARRFPGQVLVWKPTGGLMAEGEGDQPVDSDIGGEEEWFGDHVRAHATAIAKQIKAWMNGGLMLESQGRPATPGDVMILVRSRSDLARLIVARLFEESVAVAGIDRLRLQAPLAVRDLLAALRFAVQPNDDLNLANLLVSPLIGWDQERLMQGAIRPEKVGLWEHLRAHQSEEALAPLRALLAAADFVTPYAFLERILSGPMRGRHALLARMGREAGDAIDELLNAAMAFEKDENPSLQHFIDWFDRGEGEIKRDLGEGGDAVRVLTVHGAKGLQAPIVILADATFKPEQQQRDLAVNWREEEFGPELPIIMPRKAERFGTVGESVEAWTVREMQEHWRLLYVAMTRAEEILAVGGALSPRAKGVAPESSWHARIERSLEGLGAQPEPCRHWGERRLWTGRRADKPALAAETILHAPVEPVELPDWLHRAAPAEARPPRPLAPSAQVEDVLPYAPPTQGQLQAVKRGTALHALFERLPAVLPLQRRAVADRWLERQGGFPDPAERAMMIDQVSAVIDDPAFADLFGGRALAEAPVAATVNGVVIAGTIDRLLVEKDRVLLVDFKTGMRVPADANAVPPGHVRQMAAYAAALEVIFPGRRIEAALLYTTGPRFILLDPLLLATLKPGLEEAKDIL
ncbi:double-strand break repair helicase AddA [Sphingobium sufflavum]|nr:double-strand break repair helicase AddA [Sphingobium sufflavum]MCE7797045.1 double-strand break repair helicase AddA [Sphingobium sufflavum]